ncbi:hypothetical protein, partial [Kingella kingae]|uniref:hypothetical protein n=1 Tax=Kingella kingae TaxID=504 RepID=UPI0005715808
SSPPQRPNRRGQLNKYRYTVYFALFLSLIACAWGSGYLSAKRHYVAQISSLHLYNRAFGYTD